MVDVGDDITAIRVVTTGAEDSHAVSSFEAALPKLATGVVAGVEDLHSVSVKPAADETEAGRDVTVAIEKLDNSYCISVEKVIEVSQVEAEAAIVL